MKRYVWNTKQIQAQFPEANSLEGLIGAVENHLSQNAEMVCEIRVNSLLLSEDDERRFKDYNMDDINELSIGTLGTQELLNESLSGITEFIDRMVLSFEKSAQLFRADDLHYAHTYYKHCIEAVENFIHMLQPLKTVLAKTQSVPSPYFKHLETALFSVLSQVLEAYQKKDYILVADLQEYEWVSHFEKWKQHLSRLERATVTSDSAASGGVDQTEDPLRR